MKNRNAFFTVICLAFFTFFFCLPNKSIASCELDNPSNIYGTITSNWTNFRLTPELGENIIGKLLKGQIFIFMNKEQNGWIQVLDIGSCRRGWIAKDYTEIVEKTPIEVKPLPQSPPVKEEVVVKEERKQEAAPQKISAGCDETKPTDEFVAISSEWLNFRSSPGIGNNIIKRLLLGESYKVLAKRKNGWMQLLDASTCKTGWVVSKYTSPVQKTSVEMAAVKTIPEEKAPQQITIEKKCDEKSTTDTFGRISNEWLNFRTNPKIANNIISKLLEGDEFRLLKKGSNGWIQIQDLKSCKKGWVVERHTKLETKVVKKKPTPTPVAVVEKCDEQSATDIFGSIASEWLNFRSKPVIGNNIIKRLLMGEKFRLLVKKNNGWMHIQDLKTCLKGWVVERHTKLDTKTATKKAPPAIALQKKCDEKSPDDVIGTITFKWLNFRSQPTLARNVISKLLMGQEFRFLKEGETGWIYIQDLKSCKKGWVVKRYTSLEEAKPAAIAVPKPQPSSTEKCNEKGGNETFGTISSKWVNFRTQPRLGQNIIRRLLNGQHFRLLKERNDGWIQVQALSTCERGWVSGKYTTYQKKAPAIDKKEHVRKNVTPLSPIFLGSQMRKEKQESPPIPVIAAPPIKVQPKPEVKLLDIPVTPCIKNLKREPIGYGRVKPSVLNIVAEQDVKSAIKGSFFENELLTILETSVDWFYVVEENTCTIGWVPRMHITNMTIEHPMNTGRDSKEPEPLTSCLIQLKQEYPIGYCSTTKRTLLSANPEVPKGSAVQAKLKKGQSLSIIKLEDNWLKVVEETSCKMGWVPYSSVNDISFLRP